jgi:hypothetical protein
VQPNPCFTLYYFHVGGESEEIVEERVSKNEFLIMNCKTLKNGFYEAKVRGNVSRRDKER